MDDCREPLEFSAGDTLYFKRAFSCYSPADGWALSYEIRFGVGGNVIQFAATPDATNTFFVVKVTPDVTANWIAGEGVLVGFLQNTLNTSPRFGERHNIYDNQFTLVPNLGTGKDDQIVTTHAQRMLTFLELQLEALAQNILQETDVQSVRIMRVKRMEIQQQLREYKEIRSNELAMENVKNGRPSGRKITPIMKIVNGQPGIGNLFAPLP